MESIEQIEAISKMQEYIQSHILEPITLSELARHAGYSPYHCTRLFKELLGKNPFEYIRSLRLSQAALKLRDEEVKVIDVALDYVFDSHEGFTRAFSKEFGITPSKYSKNPPPIPLFMPEPIRFAYHYYHKGDKKMETKQTPQSIFVQVVERPERKLILKRGKTADEYFAYCEEVGCDVWGVLCSIKEALYEPIGVWLSKPFRPEGTSLYAHGVEVPLGYTGVVPEGFDIITLPACKIMIFQGPPYDDEAFEEAVGDMMGLIDAYNPELYGFKWADDDAPRFQLAPQGYRGYIEGRPVRPIHQ